MALSENIRNLTHPAQESQMTAAVSSGRDQRALMAFCMPGKAGTADCCVDGSAKRTLGDDLTLPVIELAKRLSAHGIECHTPDMRPLHLFNAFLFFDMPEKKDPVFRYAKNSQKPMFLIVVENLYILPRNAEYGRYRDFKAVFTYDDTAVNRGIAEKLNYVCSLRVPDTDAIPYSNRKTAVMVSSLIKVKKHKPQLCSYMRLKTIRFYEKFATDAFDLYGHTWDQGLYTFQDRPEIFRWFSFMKAYKLLPRRRPRCWRGMINGLKRDVIGGYRFVYCYENTTELPGYITEKIFDVMMAGSVPIYLGHASVSARIPKDCYIDRADFADDAQLYDFISRMPEERWQRYLDAARNFLESQAAYEFSIPKYVKTVTDAVLPFLTGNGYPRR